MTASTLPNPSVAAGGSTQPGIDAPICQDDRLGGLDVCLARSIVCHDPLVDLAGEEAFEAPDDLACGPAASSPSCDVVDGRLVESHADDDGAIEDGVGLSVATSIVGRCCMNRS